MLTSYCSIPSLYSPAPPLPPPLKLDELSLKVISLGHTTVHTKSTVEEEKRTWQARGASLKSPFLWLCYEPLLAIPRLLQ